MAEGIVPVGVSGRTGTLSHMQLVSTKMKFCRKTVAVVQEITTLCNTSDFTKSFGARGSVADPARSSHHTPDPIVVTLLPLPVGRRLSFCQGL